MDLRYSQTEQQFRAELRAWLAAAVPQHGAPPPRAEWDARRAYDLSWQRKLYDAGYAGVHWPAEYGGRGATHTQELIYYEEYARARAPYVGMNFVGIRHGGPTLIAEGTAEQKRAHLPRILRGEEVWCQGFSEPGAGSDLAALRTTAVREGDAYIINGHKVWTSFAQKADYCELLARTNPAAPKHRGISWFILPMNTPGISIQPVNTIRGESDFAEMFLEDVKVPAENLVGAENDGWRITNVTLRFERGSAWAQDISELQALLSELAALPGAGRADAKLGMLAAEADALWALLRWQVSEAAARGMPGMGASALKLAFSELSQRVHEYGVQLLGRAALSCAPLAGGGGSDLPDRFLNTLSLTIAAGSSQVQRNLISERILEMPREPR